MTCTNAAGVYVPCAAPAFSESLICSMVSDDLFQRFMQVRARLATLLAEEDMHRKLQDFKRLTEEEYEQRYLDRVKANEEERCRAEASRHRRHITSRILTLSCPRCGLGYVDHVGCAAVKCRQEYLDAAGRRQRVGCGCSYCAFCLKDCGNDAHEHVRTCEYRVQDMDDGYFASASQYQRSQNRRRIRMVSVCCVCVV